MNPNRPQKPLFCIAHRGGSQRHTENTLNAFEESLALGVDAIEIDVWLVGGQLLVTHDRRLGNTLPGQGRLLEYHPDHLRNLELDCGSRVATLQEVLTLLGDRVTLNIELKGPGCATPVAQALQAYCSDHGLNYDSYVISSFDHRQLYQFRSHLPEVRIGVLTLGIPLDYAACGEALHAWSFHPNIDFINQALVDDAHRRGFQVWVYTVNEIDDLQWMMEMGVDGVFTDYPQRVLDLNKEISKA
ncbi:glycerophosphodiester phosphodiesterase [Pseudomaricurvus alkylphenolicus]|uniref:glycerophosphodiester phosphodiesterase n=1 Tax=Pseudomaricurvus alkylphenolicus TaxID=1306991 RepID=UPI00142226F2|nr:glycerophosphodiester phosphodiesterase [Pseudomaricurvus alkylphenolicus]NIB41827.1 glycerophosphodiester phosphodiesterase [Pseudomaricurvus alkylphenolicus]